MLGQTLIEVLLALTLLAIAASGALRLEAQGVRALARGLERAREISERNRWSAAELASSCTAVSEPARMHCVKSTDPAVERIIFTD